MTVPNRSHAGGAKPTALSGPLNNTALSFTVTAGGGTGWPDGSGGVFIVCIDQGLAGEEKILCSARAVDTFTVPIGGRGYDETVASAHANLAGVTHVFGAVEADEINDHILGTTAVHAASAIANTPAGNIAATDVQAALNELDTEKVAASNTTLFVLQSLVDAKGDLIVGSADNTVIRKAVGADATVLTADAASAGGVKWGTAASGGGLLGYCQYDPAGAVSHTISTLAFAALDTTNLRATFVGPASGAVKVEFGAWGSSNGAAADGAIVGILDGSTVIANSGYQGQGPAASAFGPIGVSRRIAVTPGTTYTWDLAHASSGAGVPVVVAYGGGVNGNGAAYLFISAA